MQIKLAMDLKGNDQYFQSSIYLEKLLIKIFYKSAK